MVKPIPSPFRVIDKPYVLWSYEPSSENMEFLESIDYEFYERTVKTAFCDKDGGPSFEPDTTEARKDVSSHARLIWNHGLETLVSLLGAYVQAPHAVHGYVLKCQNEDCRRIAQFLLSGNIPSSHCLRRSDFDFPAFVRGIHARTPWINDEQCMTNLSRALRDLLAAYDRDDHRGEYNSIKHGLRASHGRSAIAIGIQEAEGIPAPPEAMEMLSDCRDGSHFLAIRTFDKLTKQERRQQFSLQQCSVGWSLEKTLLDIQLISCLIGNIVGALKVAAGAPAGTVQFFRPEVDEAWWQAYFDEQSPAIYNLAFAANIELPQKIESAERQASSLYRKQAQTRLKTEEQPDDSQADTV